MNRAVAFVLVALVLCVLGLTLISARTVNVVWFRHRPLVLKFGRGEALGRCTVRETDDPKSDVLSNLIDLESDGQPEYRLTASIDGAIRLCERRAFLGFWRETEGLQCFAAVERCH